MKSFLLSALLFLLALPSSAAVFLQVDPVTGAVENINPSASTFARALASEIAGSETAADAILADVNANAAVTLDWARVNKSGSSLADLDTAAWSALTGTPTTLTGYGITDTYTKDESDGNFQARDDLLTALAALTTSADRLIYATGSDTFSQSTITAFSRTLLTSADVGEAQFNLSLVPGANVQTQSGNLDTLSSFTNLTELAAIDQELATDDDVDFAEVEAASLVLNGTLTGTGVEDDTLTGTTGVPITSQAAKNYVDASVAAVTDALPIASHEPAVVFNGTTGYALTDIQLAELFRPSFSLLLKIQPTDGQPASNQGLFGCLNVDGAGLVLYLTSAGKVLLTIDDGVATTDPITDAVFDDGANAAVWVGLTVDYAGNAQLYINGVASGDAEDASSLDMSSLTIVAPALGAINNNGTAASFFDGAITDVVAFNIALTAAQVLAKTGKQPTEPLVDYGEAGALNLWISPAKNGEFTSGTTTIWASSGGSTVAVDDANDRLSCTNITAAGMFCNNDAIHNAWITWPIKGQTLRMTLDVESIDLDGATSVRVGWVDNGVTVYAGTITTAGIHVLDFTAPAGVPSHPRRIRFDLVGTPSSAASFVLNSIRPSIVGTVAQYDGTAGIGAQLHDRSLARLHALLTGGYSWSHPKTVGYYEATVAFPGGAHADTAFSTLPVFSGRSVLTDLHWWATSSDGGNVTFGDGSDPDRYVTSTSFTDGWHRATLAAIETDGTNHVLSVDPSSNTDATVTVRVDYFNDNR